MENSITNNLNEEIAKAENEENEKSGEEYVDLERYHDPEGLSVKKMDFGLWFISHRELFLKIRNFTIFALGLACWLVFFGVFGHYLIVGMSNDQRLVNELLAQNLVDHRFFSAVAPRPLILNEVDVINIGEGKADILTTIRNVNKKQWAEFTYVFELGGEIVKEEKNYILPDEVKYLSALNKELAGRAENVKFSIKDVSWRRLDPHQIPSWDDFRQDHLDIPFNDVVFTPAQSTVLSERIDLNNITFSVYNDTPYNYKKIDLIILLFSSNKVIGVNKIVLENLLSNRDRPVDITWPGKFGRVGEVVIIPQVNILDDNAYFGFSGDPDHGY